jgi:hypothetical protein
MRLKPSPPYEVCRQRVSIPGGSRPLARAAAGVEGVAVPVVTSSAAPAGQVSLSRRATAALLAGFLVITLLLALTTVTLISQRQRTVLLNRQLGSLLAEATLVVKRAGPTLAALPSRSATVTSGAHSAAELIRGSRSLIADLRARGLPDAVSAAGQLLETIDQPGAVQRVVAGAARGLRDLDALVALQATLIDLQRRSVAVQSATLDSARRTRALTARSTAAARRTLAEAVQILAVARQTLGHVASIDRKVGPVP